MQFYTSTLLRLATAIAALHPGLLLADTIAFPEARIGNPGYEATTLTSRRKGPEDYSSKIIGTPISVKAGQVVQSVWFLVQIADENLPIVYDPTVAIQTGVIRAGIATEAGFRANPLAQKAQDFSNNLAYNSGVGTDPGLYSERERQRLSTSTIPELPGFMLIGVEFEHLWQADHDQVVYAWANIEYSYEPYIAKVYQFEDELGHDLQVYQDPEIPVHDLGYTSMIWAEYGDPFLYEPTFTVNTFGSKQKIFMSDDRLKPHKLFSRNPYRFSIVGSGGLSAQADLSLHANIQGLACPFPIATLKTDAMGAAQIERLAPRMPRRRIRFELELRNGSDVVSTEVVKLIRPQFAKSGRLRTRQKLRLCDKLSLP